MESLGRARRAPKASAFFTYMSEMLRNGRHRGRRGHMPQGCAAKLLGLFAFAALAGQKVEQLLARMDVELRLDGAQVRAHGVLRDGEVLGDPVGAADLRP